MSAQQHLSVCLCDTKVKDQPNRCEYQHIKSWWATAVKALPQEALQVGSASGQTELCPQALGLSPEPSEYQLSCH